MLRNRGSRFDTGWLVTFSFFFILVEKNLCCENGIACLRKGKLRRLHHLQVSPRLPSVTFFPRFVSVDSVACFHALAIPAPAIGYMFHALSICIGYMFSVPNKRFVVFIGDLSLLRELPEINPPRQVVFFSACWRKVF